MELTARIFLDQGMSLADMLFTQKMTQAGMYMGRLLHEEINFISTFLLEAISKMVS